MGLAVERLLQLRAFEPLKELRRYLSIHSGLTPEVACAALVEIDEAFVASDHEAALELHALLDPSLVFNDFELDLRKAISSVILTTRPEWAKRVFLGRVHFLNELDDVDAEVRRCFNQAGLFGEAKPGPIADWWYELNHHMRGFLNFANAVQGRKAEEKTLAMEIAECARLGLTAVPVWKSLDNNQLGFDIQSYRPSGTEFPTNLLIEVKSSSRNPPVVIISREECLKAKTSKDRYIFHVWHVVDGEPMHLFVWTYDMIAEHIPTDCGKGTWTNVAIPIKAVKKDAGAVVQS
jgi:hypothetical protein